MLGLESGGPDYPKKMQRVLADVDVKTGIAGLSARIYGGTLGFAWMKPQAWPRRTRCCFDGWTSQMEQVITAPVL